MLLFSLMNAILSFVLFFFYTPNVKLDFFLQPVAGQVDDHEVIPLCCCKISIPSFNKMLAAVTYCQALDSVDNKV